MADATNANGEPVGGHDMFEHGRTIRREVVGAKAVDRLIEQADDFNRPMQELVTSYCWGAVWGRPGLDRRSRSILNLGMLAALNKPDELAGHVRGALANGLTRDEIQECLLQVAVYAGMPAGISSFRVATKVFADLDSAGDTDD